jgi:large subunit ribosomal protein L15
MRLSELAPPAGAKRNRKRVGRGPGSGQGKTSGRGHKGQLARSGGHSKPYRDQMPLHRRVPKRGFRPLEKKSFQIVNLGDLGRIKEVASVTPAALQTAGLVARSDRPVKILGDGEVAANLTVEAHAFSRSAKEKIEAKGGKVIVLNA